MKKANEIVTIIKNQTKEIYNLMDNENIDFIGCSEHYCEEKINYLIDSLKNFKKYLKSKEND